jgi:hypothetical protein
MNTKKEKIIKPDQKSDYERECMYCKDSFIANHQLRRFCVSKNGIPNYCKNRYKVLLQGARLAGENIVVDHMQDIPPVVVRPEPYKAFDGPVTKENIEAWQATANNEEPITTNTEITKKNIEIIDELLIDGKPKSFSFKTLVGLGLELYGYNKRKQLPGSELAYIEIGIYALFWTTKNEILITPITEILWM